MNSNPLSSRFFSVALPVVGALVLGATLSPAHAEGPMIATHRQNDITYVNGGVGIDQERMLKNEARNWPLRMTFSERKDNEFLAGVRLRIEDAKGATVLRLDDAGPMTFAALPAGTYRVVASVGGKEEARSVKLDGARSGKDLYFHWRGSVELDPYDGRPMGGNHVPG